MRDFRTPSTPTSASRDRDIPTTIESADTSPFLKFGIASGVAGEPAFRLGEPDETRLDVYRTEFGIDVWKENAGFHAALRDAELVIAPGKGDSFLRTIAGDGAKLKFSVGIIADSEAASASTAARRRRATLPVGRSIAGVLTVHHVEIALGPSSTGGDLGLELSGAFTAHLGPFSVVVDRLGFQLDADRREDGNFGPFHLDLGFKRAERPWLAARHERRSRAADTCTRTRPTTNTPARSSSCCSASSASRRSAS